MILPKDSHIPTPGLLNKTLDVLHSGSFSGFSNLTVRKFEKEFSKKFETKAIAVTNCTSAIEAVLRNLNIKGEVLVPAYGYMATVQAIKNAGCTPKFVDIDESFTLDVTKIKITKETKAIIPVHTFGNPCNMKEIMKIANEHNLVVIEDCAHALGAKIEGKNVGNFGIGCHSLGETKMLRVGEGGMVTGDSTFIKDFRKYVHEGETIQGKSTYDSLAEYSIEDLDNITYSKGANLRFHPLLAAVGLAKLEEYDIFKKRLEENARFLMKHCKFKYAKENGQRVFSSLPILVENRDILLYALAKSGVPVGKYFPQLFNLPVATYFAKNHLLLPIYPNLKKEHMQWIAEKINETKENLNKFRYENEKIKEFYSFNLFTL
jgi:perosamine synthetase